MTTFMVAWLRQEAEAVAAISVEGMEASAVAIVRAYQDIRLARIREEIAALESPGRRQRYAH